MPRLPEIDLAPGVHLAWVDEDIVVLDVKADAYILMVGAAALLHSVRQGGGVAAEPTILNDLAVAGLTSATREPTRRALPLATKALRLAAPSSRVVQARAFFNALSGTFAFKRRSLPALLQAARRQNKKPGRRDLAAVLREATAFEIIRPWAPFEGDCLQRSWMLHRHLRQRGLDADWVFGVRTWPFFAHCWVQVGDAVVGDSLDRVSGFTPIMAA